MADQTSNVQLNDSGYVFAAASNSVAEGDMIEVTVGKETIVVARIDGSVYAVDGICTHAYSELIDGEIEDHCLLCPLHFASFDIRDGSVVEGPADQPLQVYNVVEQDDAIWIKN